MKPYKRTVVRRIQVMRKYMIALNRVPYLKKYSVAIATDMLKLAEDYELSYSLVTNKLLPL
jgi:hypothetical protein